MPRPRTVPVQSLTPGQATWILQRMIEERRVSPSEVNRYVNDMQREIHDLERQLAMLKAASGTSSSVPSRTRTRPGRPAAAQTQARRTRTAKRAQTRTPEQQQSMKLQGRYLGLIRQIPANKRGQYQKLAKDKGREAAINAMADVLKKNK